MLLGLQTCTGTERLARVSVSLLMAPFRKTRPTLVQQVLGTASRGTLVSSTLLWRSDAMNIRSMVATYADMAGTAQAPPRLSTTTASYVKSFPVGYCAMCCSFVACVVSCRVVSCQVVPGRVVSHRGVASCHVLCCSSRGVADPLLLVVLLAHQWRKLILLAPTTCDNIDDAYSVA